MNVYDILVLTKHKNKFTYSDLIHLSRLNELEFKPLFNKLFHEGYIVCNEILETPEGRVSLYEISNFGFSYLKEEKGKVKQYQVVFLVSLFTLLISISSLIIDILTNYN